MTKLSVCSEGWTTGGGTVIIIGDNFFDGLQVLLLVSSSFSFSFYLGANFFDRLKILNI